MFETRGQSEHSRTICAQFRGPDKREVPGSTPRWPIQRMSLRGTAASTPRWPIDTDVVGLRLIRRTPQANFSMAHSRKKGLSRWRCGDQRAFRFVVQMRPSLAANPTGILLTRRFCSVLQHHAIGSGMMQYVRLEPRMWRSRHRRAHRGAAAGHIVANSRDSTAATSRFRWRHASCA